jgi:FKBP-type peptidyl-prolyl cis-trans isomerase FklB
MRLIVVTAIAASIAFSSCSGDDKEESTEKEQPEAFAGNDEKYSYCWGMNMAMNRLMTFERFGLDKRIDLKTYSDVMISTLKSGETSIPEDSVNNVFSELFNKLSSDISLSDEEVGIFTTHLAMIDAFSILKTSKFYQISDLLDKAMFERGMNDILTGKEPRVDEEEANQIISNYFYQLQSDKSIKESAEFMAENAKKDSVQITPSGLQYTIVRQGTGKKPGPESKVRVNYRGQLLDGKVFDSSYERPEPTEFGLNQVIAGWTEGLQLMSEGAKFRFYIPAELAYGANPDPRSGIPPHAALIFDVELLQVLD